MVSTVDHPPVPTSHPGDGDDLGRPFDPDEPAHLAALDRLAAGGDPDAPIPDDAVVWRGQDATAGADLLPDWYMPAPAAGTRSVRGWRRVLAWLLVVSALAVVASGLCNTYGELVIA